MKNLGQGVLEARVSTETLLIVAHLLLCYTSYCGAPLIVVHLLLWRTSYCGTPLIVAHLLLWCTSYCGTPLIGSPPDGEIFHE